ncbi:DsbA family protein [Promicromonospora thailandica]|uniref:Protein-disulfide isomerase n=1 Tax=Promicromonospora thailandica TaxID=765201 RepID=A0A9X2G3M6_9MICO|nr:thioredoxin domain-containing protein [Promicromonospora thailandica]MCP2264717.1 Protein-disulfide isomerase [Promicromonospora thailandica]BFF20194.1 thioredoxin domain-containing protein [Promicromonospora thailandica]
MSTNQTKAQRRDAARAEALALQKKQQSREKRNRILVLGGLALAVIALGVAIWLIVAEGQKTPMEKVENIPAGVVEQTGIPVGADGAAGTENEGAKTLDVYVDYMCPICGQFESLNGASITEMREAGDVTLVVHPISILDRTSKGTEYSTRAAASAAWVADRAPEQFNAYHEALFANQPEEQTAGLTDEQLGQIAGDAGVPVDVASGISSGDAMDTYEEWVTAATQVASDDPAVINPETGGLGTPTVLIDGERFNGWQAVGALTEAITGEAPPSDAPSTEPSTEPSE